MIYFNLQLLKKKKKNSFPNFDIKYPGEMKLVPINTKYRLLSFDAFKFASEYSHGGSLSNFIFFNVYPQNFTKNSQKNKSVTY